MWTMLTHTVSIFQVQNRSRSMYSSTTSSTSMSETHMSLSQHVSEHCLGGTIQYVLNLVYDCKMLLSKFNGENPAFTARYTTYTSRSRETLQRSRVDCSCTAVLNLVYKYLQVVLQHRSTAAVQVTCMTSYASRGLCSRYSRFTSLVLQPYKCTAPSTTREPFTQYLLPSTRREIFSTTMVVQLAVSLTVLYCRPVLCARKRFI